MPVIRERKFAPEILAKYAEKGTCVSIGSEAWWLEGKRLKVGIIQSVDEAGDTITIVGTDGKPIQLSPMSRILFVEAPKGLKAKV